MVSFSKHNYLYQGRNAEIVGTEVIVEEKQYVWITVRQLVLLHAAISLPKRPREKVQKIHQSRLHTVNRSLNAWETLPALTFDSR